MALLRDSAAESDRLLRYLVGLLPEDEAERLDEQSIVDDDVACRLLGVENDLVDAYVREALEPGLRRQFESHYLVSPIRRRRVMFARRFLAAVDRRPPAAAAASCATHAVRFRTRVTSWMSRQKKMAWPPLAVAATLLLAVGALSVENVSLRTGLSRALNDGEAQGRRAGALSSELNAARASNARLTKSIENARAGSNGGERSPAATAAPAAIVLLPQTRSVGPLPTLAVAPTAAVPLDLRLESRDFSRYRAALRDQDAGAVVWESEELAAPSIAAAAVSLVVPGGVLKPSHRYSFELAGVDASGRGEPVGGYAFQIDPR